MLVGVPLWVVEQKYLGQPVLDAFVLAFRFLQMIIKGNVGLKRQLVEYSLFLTDQIGGEFFVNQTYLAIYEDVAEDSSANAPSLPCIMFQHHVNHALHCTHHSSREKYYISTLLKLALRTKSPSGKHFMLHLQT